MATLQTVGPAYRSALREYETLTPGQAVDLFVDLQDTYIVYSVPKDDPENDLIICLGSLTKQRGKEEFVFSVSRTLHNTKSHIMYHLQLDMWYDADTFRRFDGVADDCMANQSPTKMRDRFLLTPMMRELNKLPPQKFDFKFGRED